MYIITNHVIVYTQDKKKGRGIAVYVRERERGCASLCTMCGMRGREEGTGRGEESWIDPLHPSN
jgi:hypothetical protein